MPTFPRAYCYEDPCFIATGALTQHRVIHQIASADHSTRDRQVITSHWIPNSGDIRI